VPGDSVAELSKQWDLSVLVLRYNGCAAMLTDAVKKGGAMASVRSAHDGAFIPVSEDAAMIEAVRMGSTLAR